MADYRNDAGLEVLRRWRRNEEAMKHNAPHGSRLPFGVFRSRLRWCPQSTASTNLVVRAQVTYPLSTKSGQLRAPYGGVRTLLGRRLDGSP